MAYLPAVFLTAGIAVLSLTESTHMPSVSLNDKLMHGLMYALLAVSWAAPLIKSSFTPSSLHPFTRYAVVLLGTTLYGALLELLQLYCTLTRSGEWYDLLADFLGALVGVLAICLFEFSTSRHLEISK